MDSIFKGDPTKKESIDATLGQATVPEQPADRSIFPEQLVKRSSPVSPYKPGSQLDSSIFQDDTSKKKSVDAAADQAAGPAQPAVRSIFTQQHVTGSSSVFGEQTRPQAASAGQLTQVESIFAAQAVAAHSSQTPLPKPLSPTIVAVLTLITLNFYWLYWLWSLGRRL